MIVGKRAWSLGMTRIAATLLSGALYGLAFPPLRLRFLAWIALVPLLLAIRGARPSAVSGLMWSWLIAASYSSGHWLPSTVETYYLQSAWLGWLFFLGVSTANAAPYYIPLGLVLRRLETRCAGSWPYAWLVGAAWVTAELARGRLLNDIGVFISNPWAQLGYSQVGNQSLLQVVSATGIYGITFLLVTVNAGVADFVLRVVRGEVRALPCLALAGAAASPLLLALAWGGLELARAPKVGSVSGKGANVAVVQGNIAWGARWRPELYGSHFESYLELTREALEGAAIDLVAWPESAMAFFIEKEPRYRRAIGRTLGVSHAELLAGGVRIDGPEESPHYYNAIFSIDTDGEILRHYDKEKLVPFGEYFPFRTIGFLRRRFAQVRVFEPGSPGTLLPTRIGPAAVAICNEAMLPEVVGRRVRAGAEFILNPSNDAWAPEPVFAEQMLDMAIVRAVEQRRWLVRASTTGPSALVDPWGRVIVRSSMGERRFIRGTIESRRDASVYGSFGDVFAAGCGLVTAACWLVSHRRRGFASSSPRPIA